MKYLCPSILSADFTKLGDEIRMLESSGADIIHCDIMDGCFVPNISFGPKIVGDVRKVTSLPIDVHLMINNPDQLIPKFAEAGADFISVHYENNLHLNRTIANIRELGVKPGVVLNPATPVSMLTDILPFVDYVLIMSVNPGFGGQSFIEGSMEKVRRMKSLTEQLNTGCLIEIDGGISTENAAEACRSGADMIVAGASIFGAADKSSAAKQLKRIISES